MKRILCLMLSILFVAFGNFCMAEASPAFSMAGFDGDSSSHDWNTNLFFTRMEARTGISFAFDEYTDYERWQQAKAEMFEKGQLPDVLFKAELTYQEQTRYTDSGQLIDLLPLLPENAPSLWALLTENPAYLEAITLPNGKIGALPTINELPAQNAMWINREWLTRLHLEMPTDAESLREVLRAFSQMDPNQNGKRDEVPFSFFGVWDLKFLSHAFGVAMNDYHLYVDGDGVVRYFPMEERFVDFVTYLRELYAEKLLDQNGFYALDALRQKTDTSEPVTYGVFFGPNPISIYPYDQAKQFALLEPLSYEGGQVYRGLIGEVTGGTFAITSACPDPAAMLRWVDELYTAEGAQEALAGVLDQDYALDAQGRWQWVGELTQEAMSELSIYDTGNMPWHFPLAFYNRYTEDEVGRINGELEKLKGFVAEPFAYHRLTEEQRGRIVPMQNSLGAYVDEALARFVLGQWEITGETMAEFWDGLKQREAEAFVEEWQGVYDGLKK